VSTPTRRFHLGAILSAMTGIAVCEFAEFRELLDFMTSDRLFTHQIPRATNECAPSLRLQFPELAAVAYPDGATGRDAALAWLAEQVQRHLATLSSLTTPSQGAYREVAPLAAGQHARISPLTELAEMAPHATVIPVVIAEDQP